MEHHHQQHLAVESLLNLLTKAGHDLTLVQFKLEREFQQVYPDNANPMKLVNRIKKMQEDIAALKEQCRELLAAKQDLIDKAKTTLVGNRSLIQRMQKSLGIRFSTDDDDDDDDDGDPTFSNFNQIIDEWTVQVRSRTGDEREKSEFEDINKLLFSAIV